jgi:hypothetical protein
VLAQQRFVVDRSFAGHVSNLGPILDLVQKLLDPRTVSP